MGFNNRNPPSVTVSSFRTAPVEDEDVEDEDDEDDE
jgi:hypothetical protein